MSDLLEHRRLWEIEKVRALAEAYGLNVEACVADPTCDISAMGDRIRQKQVAEQIAWENSHRW